MKARTRPLLVEIGCEEIPARFLNEAQAGFGKALGEALAQARLLPEDGRLETYSTPRRLVAWLSQVLEGQPDQVEEVLGPPVRVAFDEQGKPTRAARSFAEKNSLEVRQLVRVTTAKGEYVALRKRRHGRPARELLTSLLPTAIAGLNFPRSMYWQAKNGPRFVRPVRWLVALVGEGREARIVPFEFVGVRASNLTYGHRAFGTGALRVTSFKEYSSKLFEAHVVVDARKRRQMLRGQLKVILENLKLRLVEDRELEDWIVSSTEWPRALVGSFEGRFLDLPREILVTVMRDHQKYFAVEDRKGGLRPHFIAVLNLDRDPKGQIRAGHERVLAARFRDAEFFWAADQRIPLAERRAALSGVTYQAELGSYAEKVERMKALAREISGCLEIRWANLARENKRWVERAVELSKCDLTTQMVHEFPELEGVVGGLYARAQGEPEEVARAIYDHYLPRGLEDRSPSSELGAVVSLVDKLDSVVGGFALGLEPTGSSDPFALRRKASGIIKVLVELSLPIPLRLLIEKAIGHLNVPWNKPQVEVFGAILGFMEERMRYYMESVKRLRFDTVRAVLAAGWDIPLDAWARAEALEGLRGGRDLEAVSVAAKRIRNILTKSAAGELVDQDSVDPSLLAAGPEKALFDAWKLAADRVSHSREKRDYRAAFRAIAGLRPTVDKFFDKVLVMAEDPKLRRNRLRLLRLLDDLFSASAQFSEIAPSLGENVDASTSKPGREKRTE